MIKVSYLISYDYAMLLTSISQLYKYVDKIILAIDVDYKTWSGNAFQIPNSFFLEVKQFDVDNKIEIYFDKFYIKELSPIECETRQRNMVLSKLGKGWKIQLDVDEYIYDFKKVSKFLKRYYYLTFFPFLTPICLTGRLITLFKKIDEGYFFIDNNERFPFITNQNKNIHTRRNDKIRNHFTNIRVIHQSWARESDEILFKIKNWGHRDDFDTLMYFKFWSDLNSTNYQDQKNFHPLVPEVWNNLKFIKCTSIEDFLNKYADANKQLINPILFKTQITAIKNKFFK